MIILRNLLIFIIKKTTNSKKLTLPYIKRLVYLIDWEASKKCKRQVTEVDWVKDFDGISIKYFERFINDSLDCFVINYNPEGLPYLTLLEEDIKWELNPDDYQLIKKIWKNIGSADYTDIARMVFVSFPYKFYCNKKTKEVDLVLAAKELSSRYSGG